MTPQELNEDRISKLESARLAMGLNKVGFAAALDTPFQTVNKWLRGENRVPGIAIVAVNGLLKK